MFERMRSWWARCIHAGFNPGWAARNVQTPVTRLEDLDAFFTEWESLINDPLNISHAVEGLFSPRKPSSGCGATQEVKDPATCGACGGDLFAPVE